MPLLGRRVPEPEYRGISREEVLRRLPWARRLTIVVGELRSCGFVLEPETDGPFFYGATVVDVDFSGLDLAHFHATGSVFERCDFSKARLKDNVSMSAWPQSVYHDCLFDRADMVGGRGRFRLGYARFERCSFKRATISSWLTADAEFVDCVFEGRIKSSAFSGRGRDRASDPVRITADGYELPRGRTNEFRGNDFSLSDLVGCSFTAIDMDANKWPADADYVWIDDVPRAIARGCAAIEHIQDDHAAARAAVQLQLLALCDQPKVFVRRTELTERLGETAAAVLIDELSPER